MNRTTRTTRECLLSDLEPELSAAIRQHIENYQLGDLERDILMSCQTVSVRHKQGLFGKDESSISAIFVTPEWLVWADTTDRNAAGVGAARLAQIEVRDFGSTAMGTIAPDDGLNITGRYADHNKTGVTFLGLGTSPDGQKFRQVLREAMKLAQTA